jgi:ribosomal protein S2
MMDRQFDKILLEPKNSIFYEFYPCLVINFNPKQTRALIDRIIGYNVPIVSLVDPSTDLTGISYPIPVNES